MPKRSRNTIRRTNGKPRAIGFNRTTEGSHKNRRQPLLAKPAEVFEALQSESTLSNIVANLGANL